MADEEKKEELQAAPPLPPPPPVVEATVLQEEVAVDTGDAGPDFELGDRVIILGGRYDGTRGRIYLLDEERIRLLPDGVSDRLIEIPIVEGDLDPSLGIEQFLLLSKRASPAFVAQINAHVGDLADTFDVGGEMGLTYTIMSINEAEDSMVLEDETGAPLDLNFNFVGIPLDSPFAVLRPRQPPLPVVDQAVDAEASAEEAANDADEFELVEEIEAEMKGLTEIPSTQRFYPDMVQRQDMFQDMLQALDFRAQKNPKEQKTIRRIVELCLLMRNEVVRYLPTGEPAGERATVFQTVGELLSSVDVPLARPLLNAKRSLYLDKVGEENPLELPGKAIDLHYLSQTLEETNAFMETQLGGIQGQALAGDSLPAWYLSMETFFKRYFTAWTPDEAVPGTGVTFMGDKEFIRAPGPSNEPGEATTDGLLKVPPPPTKKSAYLITPDNVGKVPLSLLKGLGPRYTRLRGKDEQRRIESGDDGILQAQVLFPRATERSLGSTRSGKLAKDIGLSHMASHTMAEILKVLGGIPDEASAGGILSVGPGGNTDGNVAIEDWLRMQPFQIQGLGDALTELKSVGLSQKELTADQQGVLLEKLEQLRALLNQYITEERQLSVKGLSELRLTTQPFLQGEALEEFLAVLAEEPLLNQRVTEWKSQYPVYKDSDIGLFAGVSVLMADLLITALAGLPGPLARERNRRVRDQFLEALRAAMAKAAKASFSGEMPVPNRCPHVRDLLIVRKVKDDDDRMQLLARFIAQYKGGRENNWLSCNNCKQNLICYHEELQIQEYLRPREKDQLHKELLLAFSGGVFQGHYMCKNCGQNISDLEFDQNMEFDDDGRPMMGRGVMVDDDAVAEEAMDNALGAPAQAVEEMTFATETQTLVYRVARQIFDRVGIYASHDAYKRLVTRVETDLQKQPTREEYARLEARKKTEAKAAGRAWKGIDYDVLINRNMVGIVGAQALIEVQTHIPDLVLRYKLPGCRAGFTGFPLGREEEKTGIDYIACGIASIKKNETPWNLTGFLRVSNDKARQEAVSKIVEGFVRESLKTAAVQQLLVEKRAYYQGLYGSAEFMEHLPETVLPGFRPVPYVVTAEEAAADAVVPAAATPLEAARAWIQTAHRIARANGTFVRGSPFSETSCCFTKVDRPREFWGEKETGELPKLPLKTPLKGLAGSEVVLPFKPRKKAVLLAEPDESLFYRVFLNCCFTGPRKGYPHEPGYTNTCVHCGFVFPESPYIPLPAPPMGDKQLLKDYMEEVNGILGKGKTALATQKVVVNAETFNDLLDTIHTNFRIPATEKEPPSAGMKLLENFMDLSPEPFSGWRALMAQTMERVAKLTPAAGEIEVAEAYGPLSDLVTDILGDVQRRINARSATALKSVFKQSPSKVVESFRTYFLVPLQRLKNQFRTDSLKVPAAYALSEETTQDIQAILDRHFEYMGQLQKRLTGYTPQKVAWAAERMADVLPKIQGAIRAPYLPGGGLGVPYFVGALLGGILADFINPNMLPPVLGVGGAALGGGAAQAPGTLDTSARGPLQILDTCLQRLNVEGLNFTEQQIRDAIAKRNESEKLVFIGRFEKMTPEEKKVELMKKRLGLGEWAVGGTKAIYAYDPDQYEREREQRIQMGLGDFLPPETGAVLDEEGYNNVQTREDDW